MITIFFTFHHVSVMFPSGCRRDHHAIITGPSRDQHATTLGLHRHDNSLTSASHHLCPSVIVCHSCCKITTIYPNMQIFAAKNRLCLHDYIKTGHFRAPFSCYTPYAVLRTPYSIRCASSIASKYYFDIALLRLRVARNIRYAHAISASGNAASPMGSFHGSSRSLSLSSELNPPPGLLSVFRGFPGALAGE